MLTYPVQFYFIAVILYVLMMSPQCQFSRKPSFQRISNFICRAEVPRGLPAGLPLWGLDALDVDENGLKRRIWVKGVRKKGMHGKKQEKGEGQIA